MSDWQLTFLQIQDGGEGDGGWRETYLAIFLASTAAALVLHKRPAVLPYYHLSGLGVASQDTM